MRFAEAPLDGLVVIDLDVHADDRGGFARTFCEAEFADAGLPTRFPQCNLSFNAAAGTLRGMHYNAAPHGEAKVVRCVRGALHDVVVDLRPDSATRFQWFGVELTARNRRALFVPAGFAHGFLTLIDETDAHYHMSANYRPDAARGFRWDDPSIGIDWPTDPVIMSPTDAEYPDVDPETFRLDR